MTSLLWQVIASDCMPVWHYQETKIVWYKITEVGEEKGKFLINWLVVFFIDLFIEKKIDLVFH